MALLGHIATEERLRKCQYQRGKEQQACRKQQLVPHLRLLLRIELDIAQETGIGEQYGLILAQIEQMYQHGYGQRQPCNEEKGI